MLLQRYLSISGWIQECSDEDIEKAASPVLKEYFFGKLRNERFRVTQALKAGLLAFARADDFQYHSRPFLLFNISVSDFASCTSVSVCLFLSVGFAAHHSHTHHHVGEELQNT